MTAPLASLAAALLALAPALAQDAPDQGPIVGRSGLATPDALASDEAAPDSGAPVTRDVPAPTLYPRLLPAADRHGEAFADRVSISPDGRRLAVGTQDGARFAVQIVGATRKVTERTLRDRGRLTWVAWADPETVLFGAEQRGAAITALYDVGTGRTRVFDRSPVGARVGVLAVLADGSVVLSSPERPNLLCSDGDTPPAGRDGVALRVAVPPDAEGRLMLRGDEADRSILIPYACDKDALGEPVHDGAPVTGLIVNPTLRRYDGVWTEDGPAYADRSLAYEMREVAASFPEPVDVYPIETTRSPNTLLLYVVGETVPGGYYVLDRYAGDLDLHVTYRQGGQAETN